MPINNISSNNLHYKDKINEFALNDKNSNLVNKDNNSTNEYELNDVSNKNNLKNNYFFKKNSQKIPNIKVDNLLNIKYNNDMEAKKQYTDLKQKFEKKEIEFQKLSKEYNVLQAKMKELENSYINKFNNLQKELENKNKEINELYGKINNLEVLKRKEGELNQNEIVNKENELNIRDNELFDKENKLKEREKIISIKEEDITNRENELNKRDKELMEKENNMNEKEKRILILEIEYNNKKQNNLNEENVKDIELNEKENKLNEMEKINSNKEKEIYTNKNELSIKNDELIKKENDLNEREKKILNNEEEIKIKENKLDKRNQELIEKENIMKEKENIVSGKEKDIINKENELKIKINELNDQLNNINEKEKNYLTKENEFNEKQNKLNYIISKNNELIEKENKINEREKIISNKEYEYNKKQIELNERENAISSKEKEIKDKENELDKKIKELTEKENSLNEREKNIIPSKEKEIKESKNDTIHMPIPPPVPDPISSYQKPTLIGLNNIGATCFMNSTLQCLSQTPDLTNYFLKDSKKGRIINNNLAKENKNSLQLSPIYLKLIKKLWDKKGGKSFPPNEFMSTIEKMNPLFKKGQAGDSKDFIIYILEQIHKELKSKVKTNYTVDQPLNQYDRNNAFNNFLIDFSSECSIISDAFFGFNETTNECLNCKNYYNNQYLKNPICYNYGIFNCLIFPLEEVKNYKNNISMQSYFNMNNMNNMYYMNNMSNMSYMSNMSNMNYMNNINQNNSVTLYDCFVYNQKVDLFTGENKNYCNICKQLYDSYYTCKIYSCPNNLIIILNRGKNNMYNIKLYFSETIDITQFVVINDGSQWIYNLYGVITHIGESGPNAHFVASCKSPVDNQWYRYNDAFVNPIKDVEKEIINFGTPYILFYQKQNNQNNQNKNM